MEIREFPGFTVKYGKLFSPGKFEENLPNFPNAYCFG